MKSQLCLVPMTAFFEPNYKIGKPMRWGIGMADWDDWLSCSDPEYARNFLVHYPADLMLA